MVRGVSREVRLPVEKPSPADGSARFGIESRRTSREILDRPARRRRSLAHQGLPGVRVPPAGVLSGQKCDARDGLDLAAGVIAEAGPGRVTGLPSVTAARTVGSSRWPRSSFTTIWIPRSKKAEASSELPRLGPDRALRTRPWRHRSNRESGPRSYGNERSWPK